MSTDTAQAATDSGSTLAAGDIGSDTLGSDTLGEGVGAVPDVASSASTGAGPSALDQRQQAISANNSAAAQDAFTQGTTLTPAGQNLKGTGGKIIAAAETLLDTPYVWGGNGPGGVDCSGLVQYAYKAAGIDLPRISYQQANAGTRVAINKLRPGDLVAWDNSSRNPGADHIAIYLGNGMVIEAPRPGGKVQISHIYDIGQAWGVRMGWS